MTKLLPLLIKLLTLTALLLPVTSNAGLDTLIKNVMPSGTMSNTSKGAIINEQSAGHLIGGSVILKTPANPGLQLLYAKAPSCKLGGLPCGAAFEMLGGGVSVVKSAELMRHLKNLAHNAGAYGGMMAIKTLCPQCEDLMAWLDAKADYINNLAKTDCEDMAKLAGGMVSKAMAGSRATRQSASILSGDKKDMAQFIRDSKEDSSDMAGTRPELESVLGDNYNLVWKALNKKAPGGAVGDKQLKEALMSISGTIIGKKDEAGQRSIAHKKSLVSKEMIEEFIGTTGNFGTSELNLYTCDEGVKCLSPAITKTLLRANDTLIARVGALLLSIARKVQHDKGAFTEDEETLISLSSLSLITKIELDLATYSNIEASTIAQAEFIEALCYDVVTTYLAKLLQEVSAAVSELEYAQIADSGIFQKFDAETRETMRMLSNAKSDAFKRYDLIAQTKARLKQDIGYFNMKFEEYCSNQNPN